MTDTPEIDANAAPAIRLTAAALLLTVMTQIVYVAIRAGGASPPSNLIWSVEALAFLAISVAAFVPLARLTTVPLAFAAIAVSGIFNLAQVGMGLAMFGPLREAGEAAAPVFGAVLAGAFFLFFAAKVLLGTAGILIGGRLLATTGLEKVVGGLGILAGGAAVTVNSIALSQGMDRWLELAVGTGTLSTLLLAIGLFLLPALSARRNQGV